NYPYQQYGILVGKVLNIAISPNKDGNYLVYINLPQGNVTSHGINIGYDQEMLGLAEIITEDLSVAERIFYRMKSLFQY
ncbi:secretion protein HlyD, partial [Robertkochia marina]